MADAEPFYVNKWLTLSASATAQLCAGLCYAFGLYSGDFKARFGWSQWELTSFGTALNLGAFAALIPGALYKALSGLRSGPRICLAFAAVQCFTGMFMIWGAATKHFSLSHAQLLVAAFLFSNSNATIDVVSVSCNVSNWPNDRGSAVGVMKAAVGLSASIFGIFYIILDMSVPQLLLTFMIVPTLACLLMLPLVNHVPWPQNYELMPYGLLTTPARFFMIYHVIFLIAASVAGFSVALRFYSSATFYALTGLTLAVLIASLWLVGIQSGGLRSRRAHTRAPSEVEGMPRPEPESLLSHALLDIPPQLLAFFRQDSHPGTVASQAEEVVVREYEVDSVGSGELLVETLSGAWSARGDDPTLHRPLLAAAVTTVRSARSPTSIASSWYHLQPASDLPPHRILQTVEFYLLFGVCFVTLGAALSLLDNLPQILPSIAPLSSAAGFPSTPASGSMMREGGAQGSMQELGLLPDVPSALGHTLLVSFSVCNTFGRILAGYVSEHSLHKWGTPRPLFFVINATATAAWTLALLVTTAFFSQTPGALSTLIPVTAAAGLTFGATWTLMSTTTSELFGLKHFPLNYATILFSPMMATATCPDVLVGRLYDAEARRQHPHTQGDSVPCTGPRCFRTAFAVLFGMSVLQVFLAALLMWRTRSVYAAMESNMRTVRAIEECGSDDLPTYDSMSPAPSSTSHVPYYPTSRRLSRQSASMPLQRHSPSSPLPSRPRSPGRL